MKERFRLLAWGVLLLLLLGLLLAAAVLIRLLPGGFVLLGLRHLNPHLAAAAVLQHQAQG